MRVGPEQFIQKDFLFYDAMVVPVVGMIPVFVYEVLRRFVRRSDKGVVPFVRGLMNGGKVVSVVSQGRIGTMLDLSRKTINLAVKTLRDIRWVTVESPGDKSVTVYVLGEQIEKDGMSHEVFYADSILRSIGEKIDVMKREDGIDEGLIPDREDVWKKIASITANGLGIQLPKRFDTFSLFDKTEACALCGYSDEPKILEVHHRDGDRSNNSIQNLITLCPSCHAKVHLDQRLSKQMYRFPEVRDSAVADAGGPGKSVEHPSLGKPTLQACYPTVTPNIEERIEKGIENPGVAAPALQGSEPSVGDPAVAESGSDVLTKVDEKPVSSESAGARLDALGTAIAAARERAEKERAKKITKRLAEHSGEVTTKEKKERAAKFEIDEVERIWRTEIDKVLPDVTIAKWGAKEKAQVSDLIKLYGGQIVCDAVRYMLRTWNRISQRFFRGGGIPAIGLLRAKHDVIVVESQKWAQMVEVEKEIGIWFAQNPGCICAPEELRSKQVVLARDMEKLGISVAK